MRTHTLQCIIHRARNLMPQVKQQWLGNYILSSCPKRACSAVSTRGQAALDTSPTCIEYWICVKDQAFIREQQLFDGKNVIFLLCHVSQLFLFWSNCLEAHDRTSQHTRMSRVVHNGTGWACITETSHPIKQSQPYDWSDAGQLVLIYFPSGTADIVSREPTDLDSSSRLSKRFLEVRDQKQMLICSGIRHLQIPYRTSKVPTERSSPLLPYKVWIQHLVIIETYGMATLQKDVS